MLREMLVRGSRLHDVYSSETVHLIDGRAAATLPVDQVSELFALQPGVVARGEELHVRGGRTGESRTTLRGVDLGEPLRGRALELPLAALAGAELASGGLDADEGGALAGVLRLRTVDPGERWGGQIGWHSDARTGTHYDRIGGRIGGPLPRTGLGVVASAEATLDDTALPNIRTPRRRHVLGGSFGWRAHDRMLGHLKLATPPSSSRLTMELVANRRIDQPFDPMWSLNGYTTPCADPDTCSRAAYSLVPRPGFQRYDAADHQVMTEDRGAAGAVTWEQLGERARTAVTLGWVGSRRITSLDGTDREDYLDPLRQPVFGRIESIGNDPFHVYYGDEPYFRRATSSRWTLRADQQRETRRGDVFKAGVGLTYDEVALRELDVTTLTFGLDSLRAYHAFAPGGWAYGQVRWVFDGLVANGGVRAEYFTAGPQARVQRLAGGVQPGGTLSFSPRLGVAYPVSVRDVFSLSYVRVQQDPQRDFLYDNRFDITNHQPLGNPSLTPATAISYQAAVKHLFDVRWAMQGALFYRDVYGLPGARNRGTSPVLPRLEYLSIDDASASGAEWSLMWSGSNGSHALLGYTYLEASGSQSREEGVPYGPKLSLRPQPIGGHALDWDRRHTFDLALYLRRPGRGSVAWTTIAGTGLPWTPRARREQDADLSAENTRRFAWSESSNLALRFEGGRWLGGVTLGLDVRNVFDARTDLTATVDGYPNRTINTLYDDYGAYRTETGQPGGAFWNDRDGDGVPGWIAVRDPRLLVPPRAIRFSIEREW